MTDAKPDPNVERILDRVSRSQSPITRIGGVDYQRRNTGGTITRVQPKLKGKKKRREERQLRQQMRKRALAEGREWVCAKWR